MYGADDYHRTHKARLARTIDLIYTSKPEGKLLEIGTSGLIPVALKELCPDLEVHVTNFDKSLPEITEIEVTMNAQTRIVTAACVDLEHEPLPFANDTYDMVVCCEVLEHMEIDPMYMLEQVNRVSKDGASLLLTTPNVLSSRGLSKMLQGVEPYFYMQYHKSREYHRHNYEYSARSLYKILTCAGYIGTVWTEDLFEDGLPDVVSSLHDKGFNVMNYGDNLLAKMNKASGVVERHPVGIYV
jgi:2-polyprenyl-3-methyl-5-hydroxy-6-metoxy-1,4-benzoquinol methylase